MQVTIGIKHVARELSLDTTVSQEEVLAAVAGAAEADVTLSDDKGSKVLSLDDKSRRQQRIV